MAARGQRQPELRGRHGVRGEAGLEAEAVTVHQHHGEHQAAGRVTIPCLKLSITNQLEKLEAAKAAWLVYLSLLSHTGPYLALLGLTGPYWALLGLTEPYLALIGVTLHLSN